MSLDFVSQATALTLDGARVLGGFEVGGRLPSSTVPWPVQQVYAPVLGRRDTDTIHEAWLAQAPVAAGESEGIVWRRTHKVLFGVLTPAEQRVGAAAESFSLRHLGEQAYSRIFRLLDAQRVPHLWRVWNYIPDIHGEQDGLERYRQFNMGRADAFERCARSVTEHLPTACAMGVTRGPLSIAFLAGAAPLLPIENPRQISAYHYPRVYGPRSPTFSRAALVCVDDQEILFVSGTASIVGHQSLHLGDVVAQTHESLNNVDAVLAEARRHSQRGGFVPSALAYRVYLRHQRDLEAVRAVLVSRVGAAPVQYVQAAVCRRELLVEVEAMGLQSR